jgi:protein TonB
MKALVLAAVLVLASVVQDTVYEAGPGITLPTVLREVKPEYTQKAMQERVAGEVHLTVVVRADGKPSDIKVVKPLHPDLDEAATEALAQWEFKPGARDGKPVAVRVTVQMTFTLK